MCCDIAHALLLLCLACHAGADLIFDVAGEFSARHPPAVNMPLQRSAVTRQLSNEPWIWPALPMGADG